MDNWDFGSGCAYFIDNWIYGYQVYCTHPTEFWINPLGLVLIGLLIACSLIYLCPQNDKN